MKKRKDDHIKELTNAIIRLPTGARVGRYIPLSPYDQKASILLLSMQQGECDYVRPTVKVPQPFYPDLKQVLSLKRQTFFEFILALILQELFRLAELGYFNPTNEELRPDK